MHPRRAGGERDIEAIVHHDGNRQRSHETPSHFQHHAGVGMFEPQLNHRRSTSRRGKRACRETVHAVAHVVGYRDQQQRASVERRGATHDRLMADIEQRVVGIRGATTLEPGESTDPQRLLDATSELLHAIAAANSLVPDRIVSAFFTVTTDIQIAFPAEAARAIGWAQVPLLCATEIDVPGALPRCIRVLLLANAAAPPRHVYLRGARDLRSDIRYE